MKLNNAKLFLLIGLVFATADANAAQCTKKELKQHCKNLDIVYDQKVDTSLQSIDATGCGGKSLNGDDVEKPAGESYCIQANTKVKIGPADTATNYVDQKIGNGFKAVCHGLMGSSSANCDVTDY